MRDIAATRVRYGYWRIHVLLRRECWPAGVRATLRFARLTSCRKDSFSRSAGVRHSPAILSDHVQLVEAALLQPHVQLVFLAARDRTIRRVGVLSAGWALKSDMAITTRKGIGLPELLTLQSKS